MASNQVQEVNILSRSYSTDADLSGVIYGPVKFSSNELASCAAGEAAVGFLQEAPDGTASGGAAGAVMHNGITRAVASAAISQGAKVAAAGSGKLRTAVSGDHVLGVALSSASADEDVIAVLISLGGAPLP